MALLNEEIDNFVIKALGILNARVEKARKEVNDQFERFIVEAQEDDFPSAMSDQINLEVLSDNVELPSYIRVGSMSLPQFKEDNSFPLLLPMKDVNAYLFNFGFKSGMVPSVFQSILCRLLLSVRPDLLKVSAIDMDFGNDFPLLKGLNNKHVKTEIIDSNDGIDELVKSLINDVRDTGNKLNVRYRTVDEYNVRNSVDPIPYHLVLIDDFPNGFSQRCFEGLFQLIQRCNARRAGIIIFINYCGMDGKDVLSLSNMTIEKYLKNCGNVSLSKDAYLQLSGFNGLDLDIKGVNFKSDAISAELLEPFQNMLRKFVVPERTYSLNEWAESLISENKVGQGSTIEDGIKVPAGFVSSSEYFNFYIANPTDLACNDYFALVCGDPGFGKTTLVKNIIINAALKYSPDELMLYLLDFANGVSFKAFKELPHVRAIMLANSKEFAVRVLDEIGKIVEDRSSKFKEADAQSEIEVDDFLSYRRATGKKMPYILIVMDEFHVLFNSDDEFTKHAKMRLCDGIKQWRKYGIGTILSTQTIGGVDFGEAERHISYRLAMKLDTINSKTVLRNFSAASLHQKGEVIMNNSANGDERYNVRFRGAAKENYKEYVDLLSKRYEKTMTRFICEAKSGANMAFNTYLREMLTKGVAPNINECDIFIGHPDLLRETDTRIRLNRSANSNVLMLGDDFVSLDRIIAAAMIQTELQSPQGSKFYIINAFDRNDRQFGIFDNLPRDNGLVSVAHSQMAEEVVGMVFEELQKRKLMQQQSGFVEQRIVLSIINAQNCYPLRRSGSGFRADVSDLAKKLVDIIQDGPALGIHVMLHALYSEALFGREGFFDSDVKDRFANAIIMTNSGLGIGDVLCGVRFRPSVELEGRVLVMNNRIDNEPYEQCSVYDKCTVLTTSALSIHLVDIFFNEKK